MNHMSIIYAALLDYEAEYILNDAIVAYTKRRLLEEIDAALQAGDQATFYRLTNELTKLEFWKTSS